ncbi:class I SAM-dependent methyltransferase [Candidatus Omnitrophota bacterium]
MRKDAPSYTARKVALNIVTLGAKPGMDKVLPPGIVETTAKLLLTSGAVSKTAVQFSRSRRAVSIYKAFDWMMPGQFEAFAHRKAFCERQVRIGIAGGVTQVLVLGAGYDTLGWRLAPDFPKVHFFEIDHPATASLKAKGIEAMGPQNNLHVIGEDLGKHKLVDVLEANDSWNSKMQTVIVAEGLLMYLPPEAVRGLFNQCAVISGAGSRIAFTYVATRTDGRPDAGRWTGLTMWILKVTGEPWLWSIQPEKLGGFLKETGWENSRELVGELDKHGVEFFNVATK